QQCRFIAPISVLQQMPGKEEIVAGGQEAVRVDEWLLPGDGEGPRVGAPDLCDRIIAWAVEPECLPVTPDLQAEKQVLHRQRRRVSSRATPTARAHPSPSTRNASARSGRGIPPGMLASTTPRQSAFSFRP